MADQNLNDKYKNLNDSLNEARNTSRALLDIDRQRASQAEIMYNRQQQIKQLLDDMSSLDRRTNLYKEHKRLLDDLLQQQEESIDAERITNTELRKQYRNREQINKINNELNSLLKEGVKYLMQSDKIIKSTVLNLGLSGAKSEMMRNSFEETAGFAARLGGGLEDIQVIMEGFANETGRARALMAESVESVIAIGRGTGLGVEQATKLAAQFEFMGKDARSTMDYVQGVVDTSERMGVNTTKILKNISENFKKLSTFTFQKGTTAFAEMAMNAEKTRVSMATALNVAEATRGLEQVIELGANLQVMGGEFTKMDPLHWLYTARNEPEQLTNQLSEMTKGIYTLRQTADGAFEKFISPADRDRLANVAKSLGVAQEEMFEIAQRRLDLSLIEQQMSNVGLSKREKELIAGASEFDTRTGKHFVMLSGYMKDISELTKQQVSAFKTEQRLLEDRAKEAQTFDEVFKATINELKTALLPILRAINKGLAFVRPYVVTMTEFLTNTEHIIPAWAKVATTLTLASLAWKRLLPGLLQWSRNMVGKAFKTSSKSKSTSLPSDDSPTAKSTTMKGMGMGAGGGLGLAALGTGGGIFLAAKGISELADSISKLDSEQAKTLKSIAMTLAITFPAAAVGMTAFGVAAAAGAKGFLALSAAAVGVGFGVNLAAKGIGQMSEGIGNLVQKSKGAGNELVDVGKGILAINAAMATTGGLGWLGGKLGGLSSLKNTLSVISDNSEGIGRVGDAFNQINSVVTTSKEDLLTVANAIKTISESKLSDGNLFSELANLLKKPLKVEFADKEANFVSNITLEIDGEKFVNKVIKARTIATRIKESSEGKP